MLLLCFTVILKQRKMQLFTIILNICNLVAGQSESTGTVESTKAESTRAESTRAESTRAESTRAERSIGHKLAQGGK